MDLSTLLTRHAFFDRFIPGARVLEVGAVALSGTASGTDLLRRGARNVVSLDPDAELPGRLREEFERAPFTLIHLVDGADVPPELLALFRGGLTPEGHLVVGWRAGEGGTPEALKGHFGESYPSLQFATQQPLSAYRFRELGEGGGPEGVLEIDHRLGRQTPPEYLLALAGERPWPFEGETLSILPTAPEDVLKAVGARHVGEAILESLRSAAYDPSEAAKATGCLAALLEHVRAAALRERL